MSRKIQILRAFAIIAVVIIHTIPNNYTAIFIRPFTNFCVAMFIFLSGYLTNPHVENISRFYQKRLSRILIPYVIWTFIYSVFYRSGIKGIFFNLMTTTVCYAFYYCFVYVELVLITPLIEKVRRKWILWLIQPTFILIVRYLLNFIHRPLEFPWNDIFFCSWFSYYLLGIWVRQNVLKASYTYKHIGTLLAMSIILQVVEGLGWYRFGSIDMATSQAKLTTMLTNVILLIIVSRYLKSEKSSRFNWLTIVGDCSFGIYLSHILIMTIISNKLLIYNSAPVLMRTITVFIVSFICVLLGRKILSKKIGKYLGLY